MERKTNLILYFFSEQYLKIANKIPKEQCVFVLSLYRENTKSLKKWIFFLSKIL